LTIYVVSREGNQAWALITSHVIENLPDPAVDFVMPRRVRRARVAHAATS
jgi:hypothetical protein